MAKVNPAIVVTDKARAVEAEIRERGGTLTAEEWQLTEDWERVGWAPSRTVALRSAGPDGAIFGKPGSWDVRRPRRSAER